MALSTREEAVIAHYSRHELGGSILEALKKAGKDLTALTLEDLAPLEEFHIGEGGPRSNWVASQACQRA